MCFQPRLEVSRGCSCGRWRSYMYYVILKSRNEIAEVVCQGAFL